MKFLKHDNGVDRKELNLRSRKARQEATQGGGPSKPESAAEGAVKKVHKDALYRARRRKRQKKLRGHFLQQSAKTCNGIDFQNPGKVGGCKFPKKAEGA